MPDYAYAYIGHNGERHRPEADRYPTRDKALDAASTYGQTLIRQGHHRPVTFDVLDEAGRRTDTLEVW